MKKSTALYFVSFIIGFTSFLRIINNEIYYIIIRFLPVLSLSNFLPILRIVIIALFAILSLALFIVSIVIAMNSLKENNSLSLVSIVLLIVVLLIVFGFEMLPNVQNLYSGLRGRSVTYDAIMFAIIQTIGNLIIPMAYLSISILALVFTIKEKELESNLSK